MAQILKTAQRVSLMFVYFIKIKFEFNMKSFCSEDWRVHSKQEVYSYKHDIYKHSYKHDISAHIMMLKRS